MGWDIERTVASSFTIVLQSCREGDIYLVPVGEGVRIKGQTRRETDKKREGRDIKKDRDKEEDGTQREWLLQTLSSSSNQFVE